MARLIDTDFAIAEMYRNDEKTGTNLWETSEVADFLDGISTVDAAPVVHGQWEKHPNMYGFVRCSECRDCVVWDEWVNNEKWKYCPNCGAKMDGV